MSSIAVVPLTQQTSMQALVPRNVPEAVQLAETLAKSSLMPEHLRNKPGDCLLIIMQAQRWGMDALSVAQCTSVVKGKLCYEGKLVAAALYSMGAVDGRLRYEFSGSGVKRGVKVSGRPRGMGEDQVVDGTVEGWATENGNWKKNPDDMLVYRGTRQWARRYAPEALLGVYTPDELEETEVRETVRQVPASAPAERAMYSSDDFTHNFPKWKDLIESGRRAASEIIAMVESKGELTEGQRKELIDCEKPLEGEFVAAGEGK
jgi:hypothetical protein